MLRTLETTTVPTSRIVANSGAYAEVSEHDTLRVFSMSDQLLFEYDPECGRTRVHIPDGDLELVAPRGDIRLLAGGNVRMQGQSLSIAVRDHVRVAVRSIAGKVCSSLTLGRHEATLEAEQLGVNAQRVDATFRSAHVAGAVCETKLGQLHVTAEKIETEAQCIVERASNVYRDVTDLLQQSAGRMKTLVESIYQFRAKRAFLKSDEDFKVSGDKIHLG